MPSGYTFLVCLGSALEILRIEGFGLNEGWPLFLSPMVSVSVSFFYFGFCLFDVWLQRFGGEAKSQKNPLQGCYTPIFIEGECLGF